MSAYDNYAINLNSHYEGIFLHWQNNDSCWSIIHLQKSIRTKSQTKGIKHPHKDGHNNIFNIYCQRLAEVLL